MGEPPGDPEEEAVRKRIRQLRNQLDELSGGAAAFGDPDPDEDPRLTAAFLEQVLAFECAPESTWRNRLKEAGYEMPAPETLSDPELGLEIWQVIQALADLRVYLSCTDHLSDRALYERLFHELLDRPVRMPPMDEDSAYHLDLLGSGSEEDTALWLSYYADDAERADWAAQFPGDAPPERKKPPYDRDRNLPARTYEDDPIDLYIDALLQPDWDDAGHPMHCSERLTADQLAGVPVFETARMLLEAVGEQERVKATAKLRNLPRRLVEALFPRLPLPDRDRAYHEKYSRKLDEQDLPLLHKARLAAEEGGLLRLERGHFSLTRRGRRCLDAAEGGALFRALFFGCFRRVNLAFFDRLPEYPGIQATLPVILWRMDRVASDWTPHDALQGACLLPAVELELNEHPRHQEHALDVRLLRHLEDFGLCESDPPQAVSPESSRRYRIPDRFKAFFTFAPPPGLP